MEKHKTVCIRKIYLHFYINERDERDETRFHPFNAHCTASNNINRCSKVFCARFSFKIDLSSHIVVQIASGTSYGVKSIQFNSRSYSSSSICQGSSTYWNLSTRLILHLFNLKKLKTLKKLLNGSLPFAFG